MKHSRGLSSQNDRLLTARGAGRRGIEEIQTNTPSTQIDAPWSGHDRASRAYRRILVALLGAGVATFAQLYAPQGILPALARTFRVDASQASLAISAATIGLALSVLSWSLVADRLGRVSSMRIALLAATILGLVAPWVPWFGAFIAIRVLEGVALAGIPAIAITYLSEEVDSRHAAVAAGTYVSGTTIGGLLGRLVAAPLADFAGWRIGTFGVAVLAAAAASVFFVAAPRPRGYIPQPASVPSVLRAAGRHMRNPRLLALYAQGFLLMGGFVALYNYLAFRLESPPFSMTPVLASLLVLAYLAGTVSSRIAGGMVAGFGRRRVLLVAILVMICGVLLTIAASLVVTIVGLVVMTGGFFAAHSIASGWSGATARRDRAQAASLYNFWYYAGSSVLGYLGGVAYVAAGWGGLVAGVVGCATMAGLLALIKAKE